MTNGVTLTLTGFCSNLPLLTIMNGREVLVCMVDWSVVGDDSDEEGNWPVASSALLPVPVYGKQSRV